MSFYTNQPITLPKRGDCVAQGADTLLMFKVSLYRRELLILSCRVKLLMSSIVEKAVVYIPEMSAKLKDDLVFNAKFLYRSGARNTYIHITCITASCDSD